MEEGCAINKDEYRTQLPVLRYSSKFCLRILRYRIRNSSGPHWVHNICWFPKELLNAFKLKSSLIFVTQAVMKSRSISVSIATRDCKYHHYPKFTFLRPSFLNFLDPHTSMVPVYNRGWRGAL